MLYVLSYSYLALFKYTSSGAKKGTSGFFALRKMKFLEKTLFLMHGDGEIKLKIFPDLKSFYKI
jgi:hypothetical protein